MELLNHFYFLIIHSRLCLTAYVQPVKEERVVTLCRHSCALYFSDPFLHWDSLKSAERENTLHAY